MTQLDYAESPPTRVRFGVLFFLCTLALLLYIDRVCIGQAASHIQRDLNLSKTQMSWAFTVFSLAYALFEVPAGRWGDKYGSRGVITRVVVFWSIFTALTGAAMGLYSLILVRFLFGAGEAGAFPNAARVITRWFPPITRGRVRGAITFVSLVGAAVAPILSAHLIAAVGWRWTFAIFGALGVVWAVAFYLWFRDDPAAHPRVNAAELEIIGPPENAPSHEPIPWRTVFASPNVWLLGLIMTVSGLLFYMLFQWFPTYLKEARGQGELASGWLTSIVMAGGAVGCLFGGWLSDFVLRVSANRRRARSLCGAALLALAAGSAWAVRSVDSAPAIAACCALALFFMQSAVPTWWGVVAEISGRHGGAMWGLMNSMASLGLMGLNLLAGIVVQRRQEAGFAASDAWTPVFDAVAIGLFLGAVSWLVVDATRSIVSPAASRAS